MNERLLVSDSKEAVGAKNQLKAYKRPDFEVARPAKTYITLDHALVYVGDNSTFSKRNLYLLSFYWIWYSVLFMGMSLLLGGNHMYFCPVSADGDYVPCTQKEACENFSIDQIYLEPSNTIVAEFKLICSREYLIPLINTSMFTAIIIFGLAFPTLIDRYGRKWIVVVSGLVSSIALLLASLTWSFFLWMVCIFVASSGFAGLETGGRVYLAELSGRNFRNHSMATLNIIWALSQIGLVVLQVSLDYWRYIFGIFMGLGYLVAVGVGFLFLDESPRYLEMTNRIEAR